VSFPAGMIDDERVRCELLSSRAGGGCRRFVARYLCNADRDLAAVGIGHAVDSHVDELLFAGQTHNSLPRSLSYPYPCSSFASGSTLSSDWIFFSGCAKLDSETC